MGILGDTEYVDVADDFFSKPQDNSEYVDVPEDFFAEQQGGLADTATAVYEGAKLIPRGMAAQAIAAWQGKDVDTIQGWDDNFISNYNREVEQYLAQYGKNESSKFLGISPKDVAQAMGSVPYSLDSMISGLATGALATPGGPVAQYGAGMAATGTMAYRMSANQITRDFQEALNKDRADNGQPPLSEQEWQTIKNDFDSHATEYGLWEAIPEAVGSAVGFKIITSPLKSVLMRTLGKETAEKIGGTMLGKLTAVGIQGAGALGEELTTETITQKGQGKVETEIGLRDEAPTWEESFKEVAPTTVALTGMMGLSAKAIHGGYKLVSKNDTQNLLDTDKGFSGEDLNQEQAPDPFANIQENTSGLPADTPMDEWELWGEWQQRAAEKEALNKENIAFKEAQALDPTLQRPTPEPAPWDRIQETQQANQQQIESINLLEDETDFQGTPSRVPVRGIKYPFNPPNLREKDNRVPVKDITPPKVPVQTRETIENARIAGPQDKDKYYPFSGLSAMLGEHPPLPSQEETVLEHEVVPGNVNTEPSEAQALAGNYKKDHIKIDGLNITIENPDGSLRKGKDKSGKKWQSIMHGHYGYFKRTEGKDGDQVDVVVKPGTKTSQKVFVVDQLDPETGRFDEHKVIMGPDSAEEAKALYMSNYEKGWKGFGAITEMDQAGFKEWLKDGKRTKKPVGQLRNKGSVDTRKALEEAFSDNNSSEITGAGIASLNAKSDKDASDLMDKVNNFLQRAAEYGTMAQARDITQGDNDRLLHDIDKGYIKKESAIRLYETAVKKGVAVKAKYDKFIEQLTQKAPAPLLGQTQKFFKPGNAVTWTDKKGNKLSGTLTKKVNTNWFIDKLDGKSTLVPEKMLSLKDNFKGEDSPLKKPSEPEFIVSIENKEDGVQAIVTKGTEDGKYHVVLKDIDSGNFLSTVSIFDKKDDAIKKAREIFQNRKPADNSIGKNQDGKKIYQDKNGVRSIEEAPGILSNQPVTIVPGGTNTFQSPSALYNRGSYEYLTTEEIKEFGRKTLTQKVEKPKKEKSKSEFKKATKIGKLIDFFTRELRSGKGYKNILQARKAIADETGMDIAPGTLNAKIVDEAIEVAGVNAARAIIEGGRKHNATSEAIFDKLVELQGRMPNLSVRTSTSVKEQAYSTPLPLAWLASELAGINKNTSVYESSAGNGALVIGANPENVTVNELNPERYENLLEMGFSVASNSDGTVYVSTPKDVVISNPPFGVVKDDSGVSKTWKINDQYTTTQIDHAMVLKALESMKGNGRAVFIVGSVNDRNTDPNARKLMYRAKDKVSFYKTLYDKYNVVDHFSIAGKLYSQQGAAWPVDIIVIDGKGKSKRALPGAVAPDYLSTIEEVKGKLNESHSVDNTRDGKSGTNSGSDQVLPETGGSNPNGDITPVSPVGQNTGTDQRGPGPETGSKAPGGKTLGSGDTGRDGDSVSGDSSVRSPGGKRPISGLSGVSGNNSTDETDNKNKSDSRSDTGRREGNGVSSVSGQPDNSLESEFSPENLLAEWDKQSTEVTAAEKKEEAKQHLSDAVDKFKQINKLLGERGSFSTKGMDEDIYAQIKTLLQSALDDLIAAGKSAKEFVSLAIKNLSTKARPYFERFVKNDMVLPGKSVKKQQPSKKLQDSDTHVAYTPSSKSGAIGTLTPLNMADSIKKALEALFKKHGQIDEFVADRLGYTLEEIRGKDGEYGYFSGEQVDAIALAIDNIDKGAGFIIGDQTGVGKGRVVAAMLRFAIKNNLTPIFVTDKPNLYADMYRDFSDIGMADIWDKILVTNANLKIPMEGKHSKVIKTKPNHNQELTKITDSGGGLPSQYQVIFTTYSQMSQTGSPRRAFIEAMAANNGMLIMDESHLAGGSGMKETAQKLPREIWFRRVIDSAHSVFYSSATYAKRPDVMDLYRRTDMRLAVDDIDSIGPAINSGGIPLQQAVASMLVRAGQYIRRERSFFGVSYGLKGISVDQRVATDMSVTFKKIFDFSEAFIKAAIDDIGDTGAAGGVNVHGGTAAAQARISSKGFSSVMHNIIGQSLLALKVHAAVDEAIQSHKEGRKPIIALANTMGSFIKEYAEENGLKPGDGMGLKFNDLLFRYLNKTRSYTVKQPYTDGPGTPHYISDAELGPAGVAAFNQVKQFIFDLDLENVPVSPIDYALMRLREAGIRVSEITGRDHTIEYRPDGSQRYRMRSGKDKRIAAKLATIEDFNKDNLDSLIVNQSASTGLSLHAIPQWEGHDPAQREMILLQAEANIDTHMQMLGRVHRAGQVKPPIYTQLMGDLPTEKRPAAILLGKMASLNANTTAAKDSDMTAKDVMDFMNKYGDKVVAGLMADFPEIHSALGEPLGHSDSSESGMEEDGAARKITGRVAMLPTIKQQEEIYLMIESGYKDLIQQLDATGQNDLEAKTFDTDAKTLRTANIFKGSGKESPFTEDATANIVDMKKIGKSYSSSEVLDLLKEYIFKLDTRTAKDTEKTLREISSEGQSSHHERKADILDAFNAYKVEATEGIEKPERVAATEARLNAIKSDWERIFNRATPGAVLEIPINGIYFDTVVLSVEQNGKPKNPLALGTWKITVAVPDSTRRLVVPFSFVNRMESFRNRGSVTESALARFDRASQTAREDRTIMTGNLLAAYSRYPRGRIINFTNDKGVVNQGILMPADFDLNQAAQERSVILNNVDHADTVLANGIFIRSKKGDLTITPKHGENIISVPASKASGSRYYLNSGLISAAGKDFVKLKNRMIVRVPLPSTRNVLDHLINNMGEIFENAADSNRVRQLLGIELPTFENAGTTRDPVLPQTEGTRRAVTGKPVYRIMTAGKAVEVNGKPVTIEGYENINFFIYKKDNEWSVTEKTTGLSAGSGSTQNAAKEKATSNITRVYPEEAKFIEALAKMPQIDDTTYLKKKSSKQDGKYGQGNITPATRRLVSALAKSENKEISEDAFKAVQMPVAQIKHVTRLGRIFKKRIVFIENSIRDQIDFEGVTLPELPNTIFIDAATNDPFIQVAAHELLHTIRRTNLKLYQELRNAVFPQIKHIGQFKAALAEREGKHTDDIKDFHLYEELIADFVGEHILDTRFWNDLQSNMPGSTFKSLVFRVKTFFKNILRKLGFNNKPVDRYFKNIQSVINTVDVALNNYSPYQNQTTLFDNGPTFSRKADEDIIKQKFNSDTTLKESAEEFVNKAKSKEERSLAADRVTAKLFDNLHFIKTRLDDRSYKLHRQLTGVKTATFAMFLEHGPLSWAGDALTVTTKNKGVLPFLKSIGPDWQNLLYWVAAKRAEQLEKEGRENWLDKDARDKIFAKVGTHSKNGQTWAALNLRFQTINKNVLDIAEQAGLIDPEARELWESNFYIPFYRIFEDETTKQEFLSGPHRSKQHISAQIKKLKGGNAKIGDPLENVLTNWMHLIDAAAKNKARSAAFGIGQQIGIITEVSKKDLVKILGSETIKRYAVIREGATKARNIFDTKEEAEAWAYDLTDQGKGEYKVEPRITYKVVFGSMKDYGILSFQKNGEAVYFKTEDTDLFEALSEIDTKAFNNVFMRMMGGAKRILSYGATFGPAFRIRNMIRDTVHTSVVSKSFMPFIDTASGFIKSMKEDQDYIEYMASGFGFGSSYINSDDPKQGARFLKNIIRTEGKGALRRIIDPLRPWDNVFFRYWEKVGSASENAARLGLYTNLKKKGMSNFDAGFEGRDLMDFSMRGSSQTVQILTRIVPFLNARFQALYKLGRASRENPKAFLLKSAILTTAALALWALFKDDERYKSLPDWDKWTYFHFWVGKDHYRIPKPFEIGALFCSLPESIANVQNGTEEGKFVWDWFKFTSISTFNIDIPQLFKPVVEERFNIDTFRGRQIVPEYIAKLKPSEQYHPWTSDTMRMLGGAMNYSPIKLQHYVNGYLSTIGMMVLTVTDIMTRQAMGYPSRPAGDKNPFMLNIKDSGDPRTTKYIERFYKLYEEIETANRTLNHYISTDQGEKAQEFFQGNKTKISLKKPANKIRAALGEINDQLKQVQRDKSLSPEDKREKIDQLNKVKTDIVKTLFEKIRGSN